MNAALEIKLMGFTSGSTLAARIVFSNRAYWVLAVLVAAAMWIVFNVLDGLLFFSPIVNFYYPIPDDAIPGFILSIITAALVGIVVSMNVFMVRSKLKADKSSVLSGSTLGTVSSMCAGCSSVGFYLASTFGAAGVAASSFLSNYQLPLRLVALALLILAYYAAHKRVVANCKVAT
ncbi:MAG TPA: hypothetical protein VIE86_00705 [Nitrososphaera sp.]